jgi:AcrR family transcriptional regulator
MPQKTFLNLRPERQREIVDACLEEFARHDYRDVSLTRIIRKLRLAKGSFYRYFSGKKELYAYLIEYASRQTRDIFDEVFAEPVEDILDAWVRFYLACARQDNAYPLLGYFGYRFTQERNNVVLGDVPLQTLRRGTEVLSGLFREQQRRGRIRPDLEVEKLVCVLLQVQSGFLDYLRLTHSVDFDANVRSGRPLFTIPEDVLKRELEAFADIMRRGFAAPAAAGAEGGA